MPYYDTQNNEIEDIEGDNMRQENALDNIEAKIGKEEKALNDLIADQSESEEPWDFNESIRRQEEYIQGLYDGRARLISRM